jgi:hypothetical protein
MDYGLLTIFLIGVALTVGGGMIVFTERGLEWMYKHGIWNRKDKLMNEKEKRSLDRQIRGSAFFFTGLIMVIGTILILILY